MLPSRFGNFIKVERKSAHLGNGVGLVPVNHS